MRDFGRVTFDERLRAEFLESLRNPHPETAEWAELGFEEWARGLPGDDDEALIDESAGTAIRWIPGEGWVADPA